jgi:hypothetical protein
VFHSSTILLPGQYCPSLFPFRAILLFPIPLIRAILLFPIPLSGHYCSSLFPIRAILLFPFPYPGNIALLQSPYLGTMARPFISSIWALLLLSLYILPFSSFLHPGSIALYHSIDCYSSIRALCLIIVISIWAVLPSLHDSLSSSFPYSNHRSPYSGAIAFLLSYLGIMFPPLLFSLLSRHYHSPTWAWLLIFD